MRLFYELYRQSGLAFSYQRYMAALALVPLAAGTAASVAGLFLMGPLAGAAFGIMAALLAFAGLVLYPVHLVATRRNHFENNFVYTLAVPLPLSRRGCPSAEPSRDLPRWRRINTSQGSWRWLRGR